MKENRIAGLMIGGGFLVRLLFLGKRQLWTEELMQAVIARMDAGFEMLRSVRAVTMVASPLDYFVQKLFSFALGNSAWADRFHAVVFGSLSLWLFFRIARRLFGSRVALYALFLMVFFPLHFHYSQEAGPYALFVCLTLLSYDLLLDMLAAGAGRWRQGILLCAVLTLLLYTSLIGIFVLLSQCVALVFPAALKPKHSIAITEDSGVEGHDFGDGRWAAVYLYIALALVAVTAVAPWLNFMWQRPAALPGVEAHNPKVILGLFKELGDNSYPMALLVLAGVAVGIRALIRHNRRPALIWLLSWAVVSIPAVMLMELASGSIFTIRHYLHITPALILLAGYGLSYVGEQMTILDRLPYRLSSPAIAYAVILVVISGWITQSHWRSEPVDWRGAAAYLQQTLKPGDSVAMPSVQSLLEYYAPTLAHSGFDGIEDGPGMQQGHRRLVACCQQAYPDPCARFRLEISTDAAWQRSELRGFTIFMREAGR